MSFSQQASRSRRAALSAAVLGAVLATSAVSRAEGDVGARLFGIAALMLYGEILVPDLRFELPQPLGRPSLVLTVPWTLAFVGKGHRTDDMTFAGFFEPQFKLGPSALRLLAGGRIYSQASESGTGAFLETGALAGADGNGVMVGVGVNLLRSLFPCLSIGYRFTYSDQGLRHDLGIDLVTSAFPVRVGSD